MMATEIASRSKPTRCINVVNFIRGVEPRFETDLLLPVQKQMEIILEHKLPASWLLQYDALVSGKFVDYLKKNMAKDHEVGFWFEMNEMHCKAAGVEWRGRPGFEWDHFPPVAFTIGYNAEERIKLADTAMAKFKEIWGFYPKSIASWNLDSITLKHLTDKYKVDAYAVCRDQIATDGFTIWGAPIAGYYPSTNNCWSPALDVKNQISTPIFRMLGQDPVYYYNNGFILPTGQKVHQPDTMEPVWISGRSQVFIDRFLEMIGKTETQDFAYAQLGQENSFPWRDQEPAYARQMKALAEMKVAGSVYVETMGESGRRFKKRFKTTPTQAQIMLEDPFANTKNPEGSIWYQSRFYRADLHMRGDLIYLRDLTVYSDKNEQPFLRKATRLNDVEQRMPPVLDGYHWSKSPGSFDEVGAGGFFLADKEMLRMSGKPKVREEGNTLIVEVPVTGGKTLTVRFEERKMSARLTGGARLALVFQWEPSKMQLPTISGDTVSYCWLGFDYSVKVKRATVEPTSNGWILRGTNSQVELYLAQLT
jgi:hypothetical protein